MTDFDPRKLPRTIGVIPDADTGSGLRVTLFPEVGDTIYDLRTHADPFDHLAVCRLIVAARELRKCVHRQGKYGSKGMVAHAKAMDRLAEDVWDVLNVIPGSGSIRADGGHD